MAQVFSPAADTFLRLFLLLLAILLVSGTLMAGGFFRSDYLTRWGVAPEQPVPFSHKHHAGELGIDCRYCHQSVEYAASAGYPPTHTCMSCHSQLWTDADVLAPVRESLANNTPLRWNRVHDLPDYVYFNHSIHIEKGVACEQCHGEVDEMPRIFRAATLEMGWCLDCHRHPERHLRPERAVFAFGWEPPADREELGRELVAKQGIEPRRLDACYVCHR
jgi:Cytochrome c7 and related cytochrome c